MRLLLSKVRKAIEDFDMIHEGDRIAVGVSGGKDSLALLEALAGFRRFSPIHFEVVGITINMGLPGFTTEPIAEFCRKIGVEYRVVPTEIGKIIFDVRQEKNPCALCAKMRRGALHDAAKAAGCNVVALGHHMDDLVETFFMSLFFEGRFHTFSPVTWLSIKQLSVIRPLVYLTEQEVISEAARDKLPITKSPCPAGGYTKREEVKTLVKELEGRYPNLRIKVLSALKTKSNRQLWEDFDLEK